MGLQLFDAFYEISLKMSHRFKGYSKGLLQLGRDNNL